MKAPTVPTALPSRFASVDELDEFLTRPDQTLIDDLAALDGDVLVLGVAGKMGPTLARLAKRAAPGKHVWGAARFTDASVRDDLDRHGVETLVCDLLDESALNRLPDAANVVFMAGRKFGASGDPALTWAMNVHVPALVAQRYARSRIVAFSTGCVYPFVPVDSGGADESVAAVPPSGDYANSCVGREQMFRFFSAKHSTPGRLLRLNYAIDLRYGVLHDVALKVFQQSQIALEMGHVNVVWQGDANAYALRALTRCTVPTSPLNVTGPETVSIRWLAGEFGRRFGVRPQFTGSEAPTGWLNDARACHRELGPPAVTLGALIDWTAEWVAAGGASLGKPTKYDVRDGRY